MELYSAAREVTDSNTIWRTRIECWIPKATSTHSEYVVFIAFSFQQWLLKRASVLRLVIYLFLTAIGLTPGGSSTVHIWLTPGGSSTVHIWLTPGGSSTVHIWLTPGCSSTVHIYTRTVHRIHRTAHTLKNYKRKNK
jgi:hypothetical protein